MDKEYWRLKKREQRAKERGGCFGKSEVKVDNLPRCPDGVSEREWAYAVERARRAAKYARMFPEHVRPGEVKYQDPLWQWENEVRGRFSGTIGGSLSGTRGNPV